MGEYADHGSEQLTAVEGADVVNQQTELPVSVIQVSDTQHLLLRRKNIQCLRFGNICCSIERSAQVLQQCTNERILGVRGTGCKSEQQILMYYHYLKKITQLYVRRRISSTTVIEFPISYCTVAAYRSFKNSYAYLQIYIHAL